MFFYVQLVATEAVDNDDIVGGGSYDEDDGELRMTSDIFTLVVKQGDITTETTDAIVNNTNAKFDLGQGTCCLPSIPHKA